MNNDFKVTSKYGILEHILSFNYDPANWKIIHNRKETITWKYYHLYPISPGVGHNLASKQQQ